MKIHVSVRRVAIGVVAGSAALCLFLGMCFIALVSAIFLAFRGNADFPADCAVVFGAAVHKGNMPGPGITRRMHTAIELYRKGNVNHLILSGGRGGPFVESEAHVMRGLALRSGVDAVDISVEEKSQSTWQNLLYSRSLVTDAGCHSVVGVSDRYHLARIRYFAWLQDWDYVQTFPATDTAPREFEFRSVIREALIIILYTFVEDV